MIYLKTKRLVIKELSEEDFLPLHQLLSDKESMYYLQDIQTKTEEESRENLNVALNSQNDPKRKYYFLKVETTEGDYVGEIGYTVTDFTPLGKTAALGYFFRKAMWGKGYAAESLREVIRFGFMENDVIRFYCSALSENTRSERVMIKAGMIKEGEMIDYEYHDGRLKSRIIYRLLKREWEKGR